MSDEQPTASARAPAWVPYAEHSAKVDPVGEIDRGCRVERAARNLRHSYRQNDRDAAADALFRRLDEVDLERVLLRDQRPETSASASVDEEQECGCPASGHDDVLCAYVLHPTSPTQRTETPASAKVCRWSHRIGYDCELPEGHAGNHQATDLDGKSKVGWEPGRFGEFQRDVPRPETAQDLKARADALLNSMTPEQVLRWVETGEGWPGHAQRSEAATSDDVSRLDDALTEMGIYLRREQLRDLAARFPALRRDRSEAASPSAWLSETWLELRASLEAALVLLRRFGECAHHEECETFNACENGVYGESETCQFDEDADEVVHDHRSCNCLIWDAASKAKDIEAVLARAMPRRESARSETDERCACDCAWPCPEHEAIVDPKELDALRKVAEAAKVAADEAITGGGLGEFWVCRETLNRLLEALTALSGSEGQK